MTQITTNYGCTICINDSAASIEERADSHIALIDNDFENPPMQGNGWDYSISLCIVNWIKWFIVTGKITEIQSCSLSLC